MIPQLRVRTEFSFRKAYGPIDRVRDRLAAIACPLAGIVDTAGTWGHVPWARALEPAGIVPAFGREIEIPAGDFKPRCWVLAEDPAAFYRFSSSGPQTPADLAAATGVIRFAGAALTDPATFDYIDVNPRSYRMQRRALDLAKKTRKPIVVTSDNDLPGPEDWPRQLAWSDNKKPTPQHILSDEEMRAAFPLLTDAQWVAALRSTHEVAERLSGVKLCKAPAIAVTGDLGAVVEAGRQYRLAAGHIEEWTAEYATRLAHELTMIEQKSYQSYMLVVSDLVRWAKQHMLVGPARGSSAGSLVCYLLRITEVDPLPFGLIFERFIDVTRNDPPDIDIDFSDQRRELIFEYLPAKYGADYVARIGSINRLQPRSVINHVGKKLGIPHGAAFSVVNVLPNFSSGDSLWGKGLGFALDTTQPGHDFLMRYPEAEIMRDLEQHASHSGVHAAGVIVATVPVVEYCTVQNGVAQLDKYDAEYLNLLKIDALGLRTLGVIEDTGCVTAEQLYGLKLDDQAVLSIFNEQKYGSIFQFDGAAQRSVAKLIHVDSFEQLDHITALARPGPLGGGATDTYIARKAGREDISYRHPTMEQYLGSTLGVVLYQEQVMRIVREIGKFSWAEASIIRRAMSGRKGKEYFDQRGVAFVEGAQTIGLSAKDAQTIWDEICSFGSWGMNKSHTVSYAIISYWCAYMKRYHPIEYAAACLRHAKDDEQVIETLRDMLREGISFTPFDPLRSGITWQAKDGTLLGGFDILMGIGPVKAAAYVAKREREGFSKSDLEALAKLTINYSDLAEAHTLWGHLYANPDAANVAGSIAEFNDLKGDREQAVVIAKLCHKKRRDENEAVLINKRGGKKKSGQTQFVDMFMVDDSISQPVRVRVRSADWHRYGERIADGALDGKDWFLIRGTWLGFFNMMAAEKIRCLTRQELL